MSFLLREKVIQANSPKLLEEEIARFAKEGWCKMGEPVELVPTEFGRPTYWAQTLRLVAERPAAESAGVNLA
jgi:hypothetical protein